MMGRVVCPLHHGNHGGLFCTIISLSTTDMRYKQLTVYSVFLTCMHLISSVIVSSKTSKSRQQKIPRGAVIECVTNQPNHR